MCHEKILNKSELEKYIVRYYCILNKVLIEIDDENRNTCLFFLYFRRNLNKVKLKEIKICEYCKS